MTAINPDNRPTASEALLNPWIRGEVQNSRLKPIGVKSLSPTASLISSDSGYSDDPPTPVFKVIPPPSSLLANFNHSRKQTRRPSIVLDFSPIGQKSNA